MTFSTDEAREVGDVLGVDWSVVGLEELRRGMDVELEHGRGDTRLNVTNGDPVMTGRIALAHILEYPDYYERLDRLEADAEAYWAEHPRPAGDGFTRR